MSSPAAPAFSSLLAIASDDGPVNRFDYAASCGNKGVTSRCDEN
jgi:hypothetical protein